MADDNWSDAKMSYCSRALPNLLLRIVLVCAPAVMYAQSACAQLPPGTSRLFAGTTQGGNFNLEFPGTGDLSSDGSFTTAEGSHAEERSRAETFGGATPSAIAEAEATSTSGTFADGTLQNFNAQAGAEASLRYEARIAQRAPPPIGFRPQALPVEVRIRGETHFSGTGTGVGGATRAQISIGTFRTERAEGNDEFDIVFGFRASLDQVIPISLLARAAANAPSGRPESGGLSPVATFSSSAIVDPTFTFDQAAFDEIAQAQGFATFNLNEHFAFEFSALDPVPEPSTLGILLTGAALCCAALHRRRVFRSTLHR